VGARERKRKWEGGREGERGERKGEKGKRLMD